MKHLIAFVVTFALAGQSLWAATPDQKHLENVRKKVSQCLDSGRRVSIETYDNRKFAGDISQAGAEDFVLASIAGSTTLRYSDVKKIKSPMDPHKRGVIVTLAVLGGLLAGTLAAAVNDR
ncbi:MAG TPA: hypothetical protein VEW69_08985 [Alphaproteobacteria bacterium]|nr:hypothetical protein [Alphaproteobacteria bacterium]